MAKRKASSPIELLNGDDDKHGGSSPRRNNNSESGASTPKRSVGGGLFGQSLLPSFSFGAPFGSSVALAAKGRECQQFCKLDQQVSDKMTKVNDAFLSSIAVTLSEQPDVLLLPMVESYVRHVHAILSPHLPSGIIPGIFSNPPPTDKVNLMSKSTSQSGGSGFSLFKSMIPPKPEQKMDELIFPVGSSTHLPNGVIPPGIFSTPSPPPPMEEEESGVSLKKTTPSISGGIGGSGFSFKPMLQFKCEPSSEPATKEEEEAEEPPKNEFKQVTEDNALYDVRCKVFRKVDGAFKENGIGQLFVKKLESGKHQVVVRAENNLGTILLNILLQKDLPLSSKGKDVMTCDPAGGDDGKPVMIIIRVKNEDAATELLSKLKEYQNLTESPS